jgi:hypothetical protein
VLSENISIIEIDESSLDKNGQWPWSREIIAKGVEKALLTSSISSYSNIICRKR